MKNKAKFIYQMYGFAPGITNIQDEKLYLQMWKKNSITIKIG